MLDVQEAMMFGAFYPWNPDEPTGLIELHCRLVGEILPREAGVWRNGPVQFGLVSAPPAADVPQLVQEYLTSLDARLIHLRPRADERAAETLAFAEGRLLWIQPFNLFSLQVTVLWLRNLLWLARLPQVSLFPDTVPGIHEYADALKAAAGEDWGPLTRLWERRFEAVPPPRPSPAAAAPAEVSPVPQPRKPRRRRARS